MEKKTEKHYHFHLLPNNGFVWFWIVWIVMFIVIGWGPNK